MSARVVYLPKREPRLVQLRRAPATIVILPVVQIDEPPTPPKKRSSKRPTKRRA
jgi:hypothetical protein